MPAITFIGENRPAFEIFMPDTGKRIRIWPDGKVDGIAEAYAVINGIPALLAHHERLKEPV